MSQGSSNTTQSSTHHLPLQPPFLAGALMESSSSQPPANLGTILDSFLSLTTPSLIYQSFQVHLPSSPNIIVQALASFPQTATSPSQLFSLLPSCLSEIHPPPQGSYTDPSIKQIKNLHGSLCPETPRDSVDVGPFIISSTFNAVFNVSLDGGFLLATRQSFVNECLPKRVEAGGSCTFINSLGY